MRPESLRHLFDLNYVVFEEVYHLFGPLQRMLLSVAFEALEALNEVLLLVVRQSLDDVDHQDAISAVTEPLAQVEALVCRVVHDLWLTPAVDGVVEEDAFLK